MGGEEDDGLPIRTSSPVGPSNRTVPKIELRFLKFRLILECSLESINLGWVPCRWGNDATRIGIFAMNERHWRALRDHVRQWVLAMYIAWQALKPVWFTDAVKAQIPDAFIPTEALRRENARARRRRRAVARLSFALGAESDADRPSVVGVPSCRSAAERTTALPIRTSSPVGPSNRTVPKVWRPTVSECAKLTELGIGQPPRGHLMSLMNQQIRPEAD
jgi:hypothetical protein